MPHVKRLIEDSLPLEAISKQSAREKSGGPGHISTLHTWWARRPLAAMRAAIFASLVPAPKDDKEREYLHQLIADIVDWDAVKNGNSQRVLEARNLIQRHYPDGPPKVLDPFMGGGSTGLEALRLGCEAHGVELNPVAYLIELCTLVYPQKYGQPRTILPDDPDHPQADLPGMKRLPITINPLAEDVKKWGKWVLEEARKEIGHLYDDPCGHTIVAYIWARTATCPNPACGAEMPMLRQSWLANKPKKKVALRMKVDKAANRVNFEVAEGADIDFDPTAMTMKRGTIVCPVCGHSPERDFLKQEGKAGKLGERMLAVVYTVEGETGKKYRLATEADRKQFEKAREMLAKVLEADPDALPNEPIPQDSTKIEPNRFGYSTWGDLFNTRQATTVLALARHARRAHAKLEESVSDRAYTKAVTAYLAIGVDRISYHANSFCRWRSTVEAMAGIFSRQALDMIWDYAEVNVFSGLTGGWHGALDWVCKVISHTARATKGVAILELGDARRISLEENSLDAIITDPPYYDSISYAELSDFFFVWKKRTLGRLYPSLFSTPLAPKAAEIIQKPGMPKREQARLIYESNMTDSFRAAQRVLAGTGICVVVFAHKSTSAWETLIGSLLHAGLVITASWPVQTERVARMRAQGNASLTSSIFIVCRKRVAERDGFFDEIRGELQARVQERLEFFWEQGIRGADFFISAIGPAVEVFGRYSRVRRLTGEDVGVAELLDLVQESVADYALGQVLNGRYAMGAVDAPTRFYVMYRWSYRQGKLPFDDARRLAQALGAEVDELIKRAGILRQRGASVTMPGHEARTDEKLGEIGRDGESPPLIDLLHRALRVWRQGDRRALAEYLAEQAGGREDALHVVAQAIASVLPDGDAEKRTLENYLQGSENLPGARQAGLGLK